MGHLEMFNKAQVKRDISYLKDLFPHVRPGLITRKYIRTLVRMHGQANKPIRDNDSAKGVIYILSVRRVKEQFGSIFPPPKAETAPVAAETGLKDGTVEKRGTAFMRFFRKVFPKKYGNPPGLGPETPALA